MWTVLFVWEVLLAGVEELPPAEVQEQEQQGRQELAQECSTFDLDELLHLQQDCLPPRFHANAGRHPTVVPQSSKTNRLV
jgi:hypothetical protein